MREIKVNIKIFTKEKFSRLGVPLKEKVGLYNNSRVLLYEGRKRNYVRFLLTKKTHKNPLEKGKN